MIDNNSNLVFDIPTRNDIASMRVGDLGLDPFGHYREITDIHARRNDIYGKLFCCYYVRFGADATSTISMSRKEDRLTRTVALSNRFLAAELDTLEARVLQSRHAK